MTKKLLYLTLFLLAIIALGKGANKCTQGKDGLMYCEDVSTHGQGFLKNNVLKKRAQKYINETVCSEDVVKNREINSDIVFIVDESASMCDYIEALNKKLTTLINELDNAGANARFALVGFGGFPRIYSPFTESTTEIINAFNQLNCEQNGQESGLEAIRMFLKKSEKFVDKTDSTQEEETYFTEVNKLGWRENSTKTIILVTDEDSDLPHYEENRNDLQIKNKVPTFTLTQGKKYSESEIDKFMGFPYKVINNKLSDTSYIDSIFMEPTFSPAYLTKENKIVTFYRYDTPLKLGAPYQKEVDETAELLLQENVQLFMLLTDNLAEAQGEYVSNSQYDSNNPYWKSIYTGLLNMFKIKVTDDSSTVTAQYGNPSIDKINSEFDGESILSKLKNKNQENSIQGQILANKGFCRAFNIKDFVTTNQEMVEMFYKTVVSTVQKCVVKQIPIEDDEIDDDDESASSTKVTTIYEEPTEAIDQNVEYRDETICSDEIVENREINSDIVFFFDESVSMCDYIEALRKRLQDFLDELTNANANARFALVGFGGEPRIYSGFTNDVNAIKKAFNKLNCEQGGQESGLEAIRMFFKKSQKFENKQDENVSKQFFTDTTKLAWRKNSTKTIILVTDEDSDLPHFEENRNDLQTANVNGNLGSVYTNTEYTKDDINHYMGFPYYFPDNSKIPTYNTNNFMEPPFSPSIITKIDGILTFYRSGTPLVLTDAYQKEVDETAQLLIQEHVQVFMLLNDDLATAQGSAVGNSQYNSKNPYWVKYEKFPEDDSSTITAQYGNPLLDSISSTSYSRDKILAELTERKQEKSVQGQVLSNKGFCRAFNIKDFINSDNSSEMVDMFYKTVVTTMKKCVVRKVPIVKVIDDSTTTSASVATTANRNIETSSSSTSISSTSISSTSSSSTSISSTSISSTSISSTSISTSITSTTIYSTTTRTPNEDTPNENAPNEEDDNPCVSKNILDRSIDSDIVFVIDESTSMCQYINPLKEKLNDLIEGLKKANADARFAIVGFGGKPRIYSSFTRDVEKVKKAFDNLSCYEAGQESGLEAIRMFINKSKKFINRTSNLYSDDYFEKIDELEWREKSQRTMILLTDEDSDLPIYEENRNDEQNDNLTGEFDPSKYDEKVIEGTDGDELMGFPYYLNKIYMPEYTNEVFFEPSFTPSILTTFNGIYTFYRSGSPLVLSTPYQKEVDSTAQLIKDQQIQLFLLLSDNIVSTQGVDGANSQFNELSPYWNSKNTSEKDDSNTITAQYGNPLLDSLTVPEFNRDSILDALKERKQEKSLQGQILSDGGFCRAFNIADFTGNESERMVELFYKNVIKTIEVCRVVVAPIEIEETTTTTDVEEETTTTDVAEETSTTTDAAEETTSTTTDAAEETTSTEAAEETTSTTEAAEETTSTEAAAEETTSTTTDAAEETTSTTTDAAEETTSTEAVAEETTSTEAAAEETTSTEAAAAEETTSTEAAAEETTSTEVAAEETTSTTEAAEETTSTTEAAEPVRTVETQKEETEEEATTTDAEEPTSTTETEEPTSSTTEDETTSTTESVEETPESTTIPEEDTTMSIKGETSTAEEAYTEITFTTDEGDETETETPTETPLPKPNNTTLIGATIGAAAGLAGAAAAIYFKARPKLPQGNQLTENVFEDNVGMENPLYEGTSGQNENPLYEANVDFDSVEDNMDAFA